MSFKFATILSVMVLAAVVQAYGQGDFDGAINEYFVRMEFLQRVEEIVAITLYHIDDSLQTVFLRNKTDATGVGSASAPEEFITEAQVTCVIDDLFPKLKNVVDAAFNKLRQLVEFSKSQINEIIAESENSAKQQLQGIEDSLKKELNELKEQAKTAGKDIDDCLDENEDDLLELPNKLSEELARCVSDKVDLAVGYLERAINEAQIVTDEVANIKYEIDHCDSGFMHYILCIAKWVVIVGKDIVTLPAIIEADMVLAQRAVSQLATDAAKCGSKKVGEIEREGSEILTTIASCIAAK